MSTEFYYEDYESYFPIFSSHAQKIVEMMSYLNYQITEFGLPPVPSHKLFRMTLDLFYHTDQTYKAEKNIADKYNLLTFPSSDELLNSMRSVFKEELDRYLGSNNGSTK